MRWWTNLHRWLKIMIGFCGVNRRPGGHMGTVLGNSILIAAVAAAACAVCAEAAADSPGFTPPANRAGQSAWIPLRHQPQERNLCVPSSASIILDCFGDPIAPREIKSLALHKPYRPEDTFTDLQLPSSAI